MAKRPQPKKKQQASLLPLILIGLGALVLVAAVVALSLQGDGQPQAATTLQATLPVERIPRIALGDAKTAFDQGQIVILDVRSPDSFAGGHIPGSVNIPLGDLEARSGELDQADWIVTACTWPNEESSARAAQILLAQGFQKVEALKGGLGAWEQAGYPVEQ